MQTQITPEGDRDVPDFPKEGSSSRTLRRCFRMLLMKASPSSPSLRGESGCGCGHGVASPSLALVGHGNGRCLCARSQTWKTALQHHRCQYEDEYGTNRLEMHTDRSRRSTCFGVDDLLATGGTAATMDLVEQLGGKVVGCCCDRLSFLNGAEALECSYLLARELLKALDQSQNHELVDAGRQGRCRCG